VRVPAPSSLIAPSPQPSPPMGARGFLGATRRAVVAGIAVALASRALAAQAQPQAGVRRIGVLMGPREDDLDGQARAAVLVQGLGALGWHEGGNLYIDWRWAGSDPALVERYAAELVALSPDVLLTMTALSIKALQRLTSTIPIVFANVSDPVGQGFVASLARPGGNITGFSNYNDPPMAGKWLGMLMQIAPPVARVAVLYNPAVSPAAFYRDRIRQIEGAAPSLAVSVQAAPCQDDAEIEAMMAGLAREKHGGVLVLPDPFTLVHRGTIVVLTALYRLPAVYPFRFFTAAGGLMSYGIEIEDVYRRSTAYVDRILKGAKPGDLPVQNPTKFQLVINLKTAQALGVTIAPSLLAAADEVIE
jgi:putative tryptophan/tyrosine transport system substrate-binding protein